MLCLWSFIAWREVLPTRLIALQIFVLAGIVFNAIVTGALSGPYDRYLARVIWLILFVGLVSICCIMRVHRDKHVFKRLTVRADQARLSARSSFPVADFPRSRSRWALHVKSQPQDSAATWGDISACTTTGGSTAAARTVLVGSLLLASRANRSAGLSARVLIAISRSMLRKRALSSRTGVCECYCSSKSSDYFMLRSQLQMKIQQYN